MELPAKLYTSHGKYSVSLNLDTVFGMITYWNPESGEEIDIGQHAILTLSKHGWILSDFWVTDAKNTPPIWRHKLTLSKWDGAKLEQALSAYPRCTTVRPPAHCCPVVERTLVG